MSFELPDMDDVLLGAAPLGGAPRSLPLADIDEDPGQPRQEFDPQTLNELAATIAARGVRQPVSVRVHPSKVGRWMLNFGARRLRASKVAGKMEIPAFIDAAFDSYDQVIENEQREALKPLELALFMQRRLLAGDTRAHIARSLGKSRGYLTFVGALIDAPDWLLGLYRSGKCAGLAELYELRKLHATHPAVVGQWSGEQQIICREDVARLKNTLARTSEQTTASSLQTVPHGAALEIGRSVSGSGTPKMANPSAAPTATGARPSKATGVTLWARYDGIDVTVDLRTVPVEDGFVFVRPSSGGDALCVRAGDLRLVRVTVRH